MAVGGRVDRLKSHGGGICKGFQRMPRAVVLELFAPHFPLRFPIQFHRNPPDILLLYPSAPTCRPWQEQDLFLDARGEVEEREDLGQSRWRDLGVAGEFGLVGDLAGAEEVVAVDGEGHEAADAGDFAWRGIGSGAGAEVLAAVLAASGGEVAGDREGGAHTAVSWVSVWMPLGRNVREIWPSFPR